MIQRMLDGITYLTTWIQANVLTVNTAIQWGCVVVVLLFAMLLWRGLGRSFRGWVEEHVASELAKTVLITVLGVGSTMLFILLAQVCVAVFHVLEMEPGWVSAASDLGVAWVVIKLLTSMISNRALAKGTAMAIWIVAALSVLGLLAPITDFLHNLSFSTGETSFTALGIIKGVALAAIMLQAAALLSGFVVARIESVGEISPSLQVLMIKAVKVCLYTAAVLFAMSSVGIDLTSLAIFSSALGVGIGFGLKTIFSNYVAGILLLIDNSIKPGDTIEVGGVFGVVRGMQARYASILTRNGKEHLIPNELLISGEVINWTYTDKNVRLKIPVGIAYDSDVDKAMQLLEDATRGVKRVLESPAPAARLIGFGDNSVDLQLRVWIADAESGIANVRSEVLLNVWNLYNENGIEFPFPQRDVTLKPESALTVKIDKGEE